MPLFNFPTAFPHEVRELPFTPADRDAARLKSLEGNGRLTAFLKKFGLLSEGKIPFHVPLKSLPNLEQCKDHEFWHYRACYNFQCEIWAGQQDLGGTGRDRWGNVMIYLIEHGFHGPGGYAVVVKSGYPTPPPIEYYKWAICMHEMEQKTIGNCLNQYTCKKCGHRTTVDSSD